MPPIKNNNSFIKIGDNNMTQNIVTERDPFTTLGLIVLVFSILLCGLLYLVNSNIRSSNNSILSQVNNVESTLSQKPLKEMLNFYNKINSINSVVSQRFYPNTIFKFLEDSVENDVYYTKFSFKRNEKNNFTIDITGLTEDNRSVVRQIDDFKSDKYKNILKDFQVKNIQKEKTFGAGNSISFDLSMSVVPTIEPIDATFFEQPKRETPKPKIIEVSVPDLVATSSIVNSNPNQNIQQLQQSQSSTSVQTFSTTTIKNIDSTNTQATTSINFKIIAPISTSTNVINSIPTSTTYIIQDFKKVTILYQ